MPDGLLRLFRKLLIFGDFHTSPEFLRRGKVTEEEGEKNQIKKIGEQQIPEPTGLAVPDVRGELAHGSESTQSHGSSNGHLLQARRPNWHQIKVWRRSSNY